MGSPSHINASASTSSAAANVRLMGSTASGSSTSAPIAHGKPGTPPPAPVTPGYVPSHLEGLAQASGLRSNDWEKTLRGQCQLEFTKITVLPDALSFPEKDDMRKALMAFRASLGRMDKFAAVYDAACRCQFVINPQDARVFQSPSYAKRSKRSPAPGEAKMKSDALRDSSVQFIASLGKRNEAEALSAVLQAVLDYGELDHDVDEVGVGANEQSSMPHLGNPAVEAAIEAMFARIRDKAAGKPPQYTENRVQRYRLLSPPGHTALVPSQPSNAPTPVLLDQLRKIEHPMLFRWFTATAVDRKVGPIGDLKKYLAQIPLSQRSERDYAIKQLATLIGKMASLEQESAIRLLQRYVDPENFNTRGAFNLPPLLQTFPPAQQILSESARVDILLTCLKSSTKLVRSRASTIVQIALNNYVDVNKVSHHVSYAKLLGAMLTTQNGHTLLDDGTTITTRIDRHLVDRIIAIALEDIPPLFDELANDAWFADSHDDVYTCANYVKEGLDSAILPHGSEPLDPNLNALAHVLESMMSAPNVPNAAGGSGGT